jgi:hypothetical protein
MNEQRFKQQNTQQPSLTIETGKVRRRKNVATSTDTPIPRRGVPIHGTRAICTSVELTKVKPTAVKIPETTGATQRYLKKSSSAVQQMPLPK